MSDSTRRIGSLKDAAAALREIAAYLEHLQGVTEETAPVNKTARKGQAGLKREQPLDMYNFALGIAVMERAQLDDQLKRMSTSQLRSLCTVMGIRGMSKRPREELIREVLRQQFDFREEQRLIRTYSQRQSQATRGDQPDQEDRSGTPSS